MCNPLLCKFPPPLFESTEFLNSATLRVSQAFPVGIFAHLAVKMGAAGGCPAVAYPGILFGGGGSINSVENRGQRERRSVGGSPLVRGSGGSCNLVQEISFHVVKFS